MNVKASIEISWTRCVELFWLSLCPPWRWPAKDGSCVTLNAKLVLIYNLHVQTMLVTRGLSVFTQLESVVAAVASALDPVCRGCSTLPRAPCPVFPYYSIPYIGFTVHCHIYRYVYYIPLLYANQTPHTRRHAPIEPEPVCRLVSIRHLVFIMAMILRVTNNAILNYTLTLCVWSMITILCPAYGVILSFPTLT